jgi:hypothetical protein
MFRGGGERDGKGENIHIGISYRITSKVAFF